jgi:formamidopyrimidine-DNA glycosylase
MKVQCVSLNFADLLTIPKFVLHLKDDTSNQTTELAFADARRFGRIRLCASPLKEPPISDLGFDPVLSMPNFDQFQALVLKKSSPIKSLLLDQSFSAGVGNWVAGESALAPDISVTHRAADEILYQARVHPGRRCNALTHAELAAIHFKMSEICRFAVEVNADDSKFPENWLFKHRWASALLL